MKCAGFYNRVKSLAKMNGKTLEFVAGEAGLTLASYNSYRRYDNLPRADEALAMARTLGTTVEFLVAGDGPNLRPAEKALSDIQAVLDGYGKSRGKT